MPFEELMIMLDHVYTLLRIPLTRTPIQVELAQLFSREAKALLTDTLGVTVKEAQVELDWT